MYGENNTTKQTLELYVKRCYKIVGEDIGKAISDLRGKNEASPSVTYGVQTVKIISKNNQLP